MKYRILKPVLAANNVRHAPGTVLAESELGFPASQVPSLMAIDAIAIVEEEPDPPLPPKPPDQAGEKSADSPDETPLVNLNTATEEELTALKYVGAATAQKLIAARPLATLAEAHKATGLKAAQWEEIAALVTL